MYPELPRPILYIYGLQRPLRLDIYKRKPYRGADFDLVNRFSRGHGRIVQQRDIPGLPGAQMSIPPRRNRLDLAAAAPLLFALLLGFCFQTLSFHEVEERLGVGQVDVVVFEDVDN